MAAQMDRAKQTVNIGDIHKPVIKIMGLGGGGSNAVNRLVEMGLPDIEFIAANTDMQALKQSLANTKVQLGPRCTRGLGAGGNPKVGEMAAEESYRELVSVLTGADMVFLTAGMGGGTGTGSIPVAARAAREAGAVTVAVVTTPFSFEVGLRQTNARDGLARLSPHAHTLITVPNDRLLQIAPRNLTLDLAFQLADDVLRQGIQGIAELVTQPGLINVDFAHIRQVIQVGGGALMSIGFGEGDNKALKAIQQALHHPLLESISVESATGIIANFTGSDSLSFTEVCEAMNYLQSLTHNQAEIIPGVITNSDMEYRTQVILVITGLGATAVPNFPQRAAAAARPTVSEPASAEPQTPARQPVYTNTQRPAQPPMQPPAQASIPPAPFGNLQAPNQAVSRAAAPTMGGFDGELPSITPVDIDLPAFMRRKNR